mmetsp:Transcript_75973/g.163024  ORF Transcript_75973/g.163024 Transcript_75973/m.163024 type:complete len:224 (+) Transcript_75973:812-1483(+)
MGRHGPLHIPRLGASRQDDLSRHRLRAQLMVLYSQVHVHLLQLAELGLHLLQAALVLLPVLEDPLELLDDLLRGEAGGAAGASTLPTTQATQELGDLLGVASFWLRLLLGNRNLLVLGGGHDNPGHACHLPARGVGAGDWLRAPPEASASRAGTHGAAAVADSVNTVGAADGAGTCADTGGGGGGGRSVPNGEDLGDGWTAWTGRTARYAVRGEDGAVHAELR